MHKHILLLLLLLILSSSHVCSKLWQRKRTLSRAGLNARIHTHKGDEEEVQNIDSLVNLEREFPFVPLNILYLILQEWGEKEVVGLVGTNSKLRCVRGRKPKEAATYVPRLRT